MPRARTAKEALDTEIAALMKEGDRLKAQIEKIDGDLAALNAQADDKSKRLEVVTAEIRSRTTALGLLDGTLADPREPVRSDGTPQDTPEMRAALDEMYPDQEEDDDEPAAPEIGQPVPTVG